MWRSRGRKLSSCPLFLLSLSLYLHVSLSYHQCLILSCSRILFLCVYPYSLALPPDSLSFFLLTFLFLFSFSLILPLLYSFHYLSYSFFITSLNSQSPPLYIDSLLSAFPHSLWRLYLFHSFLLFFFILFAIVDFILSLFPFISLYYHSIILLPSPSFSSLSYSFCFPDPFEGCDLVPPIIFVLALISSNSLKI